ncbi:group II intron reverse transcriptase/maturase [Ruminococcus bicirculans]|uniref:Group II intron reverse transcriptase/maturase n=1 Tax=Ruminococcus bicirculans (ex Wegman et al. 2014) TaxID=1160721 RepID=A0AAW6E8M4_9FIRM|nr:group II intron reverse transcriptase/maturase [Ruminococcus bicirculans (ex Wegman et al. 2014)]MDB8744361.1 group II intron reverse transcriptase/maturase [Ruminococcus bicirculans (ex Wegman et al. 2014)]MDB8747226.1 group II intron reverse transcriptase/maturase [Ruminococcus bicirculans (ex Wegman et al. 2014)]MDB8752475.1 group II intron reverse transcriptase/maturase [Ruminococcus bicirculans (ex Wegman et al. 2014)]
MTKKKPKKKARLRNAEYYDLQNTLDKLYAKSKNNCCFRNLMQYVASEENIKLAYRNIKKNKGSKTAGADDKTIEDLNKWSISNLISHIQKRLKWYQPNKIRRVEIPKDNGKTRPLGIPTIMDRLIQQCFLQIIEPICEAKFFERSNGFRPNRSAENAISQVYKMIQTQHLYYVVDVDIKAFFDNVSHGKLLKQMWTMGIQDKQLLKIISLMLKAEVAGIGFPEKGTPQGGIISPLLSNIVLNELDWWVASQWETLPTKKVYKGKELKTGTVDRSSTYVALRKSNLKECYIVRYADDFKIFCRKRSDAVKIFEAVKLWLKERLGLEISPEKSKIVNLKKSYSEFLGFKITAATKGKDNKGKPKYVVKSILTDKAIRKIKKKASQTVKLIKKPINDKEEFKHITFYNSYVIGVHNYYRYATHVRKVFDKIAFQISRKFYARTKRKLKRHGKPLCGYIKEHYGKSREIRYINGNPIIPLGYVQHKNPMDKKKVINNYTAEGRAEIHKMLETVNIAVLHYMMRNPILNRSIEYNDNRLSLYCASHGKCSITGKILEIGNIHCHHKIPYSISHDDSYGNLILICQEAHILIHAVNSEVIQHYKSLLNLNAQQIGKINKLRKLLNLADI